ncbi:hypothetical protein HOK68_05170 [Candidatus Woesearchaeota archaeon]|nr:hypothetical protein [Candidatus Woesearchaeota archaeon]
MKLKNLALKLGLLGLLGVPSHSYLDKNVPNIESKVSTEINYRENAQKRWDRFHLDNPNESVYDMSSVNLPYTKKEVRNKLESFLKKTDSEKYESNWKASLNEKDILTRFMNINMIWQYVIKKGKLKGDKQIYTEDVNYKKILDNLDNNLISGQCSIHTAFLVLNFDTFSTKQELIDNNITYSLYLTVGDNLDLKTYDQIKSSKQLNHTELIIHTKDSDFIIDNTRNILAYQRSTPFNLQADDNEILFHQGYYLNKKIVEIKPKEINVVHYPKQNQLGIVFPINSDVFKDMMNGSFIYFNDGFN